MRTDGYFFLGLNLAVHVIPSQHARNTAKDQTVPAQFTTAVVNGSAEFTEAITPVGIVAAVAETRKSQEKKSEKR